MRSFKEYWNEHGDVYAMEIAEEAWDYQQSKIDELQKQVTDLDNRATKYALDAMATAKLNAELQKRVDAVKALIEEYRDPPTEDKTFQHALSIVAYELEQALKGGEA